MKLVFLGRGRLLASVFFYMLLMMFAVACGSDSSESSGGGKIPLTSPKSFQITGKDGELEVKWSKLSAAQGVEATYEVWYGTSDNVSNAAKLPGDIVPSGNLCAASITGLTNGTTYYVWVKAKYGSLGEADFNVRESGVPVAAPAVPTNVSVVAGETLLEITWNAVNDPAAPAFSYEVAYHTGTNSDVTKTVSSPYVVLSGLTNGSAYTVKIRSVNTDNVSAYTSTYTGTPVAATLAPDTIGTITVTPGNKRLSLSWDSVSRAVKYDIYYNTTNNFGSATLYGSVNQNLPKVIAGVSGLTNGTTYYVWVTPKNTIGGVASSSVSGTPEARDVAIDFSDMNFVLGDASAEYIFAEFLPLSAFSQSGKTWDRLTRVKETALGNLFTDGAAAYIRDKYASENIDFVFLNGGFIDNALQKGQITVGDLLSATQPDNREYNITFLTLKGSDLITLFNAVADVVHTGRGGPENTKFWAIVSKEVNYKIVYPTVPQGTPDKYFAQNSAEAEPYYHGVIAAGTLKINGQAVDPNANYRIATTSNLASGSFFTTLVLKGTNVTHVTDKFWHAVAEYIYEEGSVTPALDGRIVIEGGVPLGTSVYVP